MTPEDRARFVMPLRQKPAPVSVFAYRDDDGELLRVGRHVEIPESVKKWCLKTGRPMPRTWIPE